MGKIIGRCWDIYNSSPFKNSKTMTKKGSMDIFKLSYINGSFKTKGAKKCTAKVCWFDSVGYHKEILNLPFGGRIWVMEQDRDFGSVHTSRFCFPRDLFITVAHRNLWQEHEGLSACSTRQSERAPSFELWRSCNLLEQAAIQITHLGLKTVTAPDC